jgi:hypothetical protein
VKSPDVMPVAFIWKSLCLGDGTPIWPPDFLAFSTCLKLGLHLIVPKGWREQFSDNPEQKTSIVIFRWIYRFAALAE